MNNGIIMDIVEYIPDEEEQDYTELDIHIMDLLSKIIEGDTNDNGTD